MLSDLLSHQQRIEKLLQQSKPNTNWKKEKKFFIKQIKFLQIERRLHLLVTLTVGFAALTTGLTVLFYPHILLVAVSLPLIILFIAYLIHYRKLENTAQYWYQLLNRLHQKQ